jgi:hypothetical protein
MTSESDNDESSASGAEDLNTTRGCLGRPKLVRSVTKLSSAISRPDMIASDIRRLDTILGLASNDGRVDQVAQPSISTSGPDRLYAN